MKTLIAVLVTLAITGWAGSGLAQSRLKPGGRQENASFLSRRFLTDPRNAAALTDDFLAKADRFYKAPVLFPNGGLLSSMGVLDHAPGAANIFLDHVGRYEAGRGVSFTVMPYLNGYSVDDTAHTANLRLDLSNPAVRANIVAECERHVSTTAPGSYVRGSRRVFDGIVLDIEPAGSPVFFASFKLLLADIRAGFDGMGLRNKKIGIAAPQYTARTPKPNWGWSESDYYYIGKYVNYVIAMTYDSGLTEESKYQAWMTDQTTHILRAVSGAAWNFDAAHPRPNNGARVLIGLPGFHTTTKAHNPAVETVANGAPGILGALSRLQSTDPTSVSYFQGAVMFSHDGGAADSMYARYDTDWLSWSKYWLGQ